MTIKEAHKLLDKCFEKASHLAFVRNPIAYALYQVWKQADREKSNEGNIELIIGEESEGEEG